jgi:hypothetical protein
MNIECFMDDRDVHGVMKRYGKVQFVNYVFQLIGQLKGKV